jgi:hypothetical protein
MVVAIGALVIEDVHALELTGETRHIAGIADVGITTGSIGRHNQTAVGYHLAIRHYKVGTILDITHLTEGNTVGINHVATDMGQRGFLLNQITTTGHTVLERDALDLDAAIVVNNLTDSGVNRMEDDFEVEVVGKELYLALQLGAQCLRGMDVETGCAPQKSESGDHANEAETVVAMQMGDEDVTELREAHTTAAQLHLSALGTVEHQHLVAHLHHLGRSMMAKGGKRTSTP